MFRHVVFYVKNFSRKYFFSILSIPTVKPLITNEYIERIHQMSYSSLSDNGILQIFSFLIKWFIWNSLKLFPHIHGYLFIFANSEIYVIKYKTQWKIVKTTFDKFFRCIRYWGFHCSLIKEFRTNFSKDIHLTKE